MRKAIKKIATVVASVSMMAALSISAFAADTYQFVGNPNLFGEADPGNNSLGWVTIAEEQFFSPVDGQDGLYSYKSSYVKSNDYDSVDDEKRDSYREFKVLADGDEMGWSFQMCLGNPEGAWADNQSQFRISDTIEEGEFTVYMDPAQGFVCIIQNQKNVDMLVRYHSRDEDSWNFVQLTKAAIEADGYSDIYFDDAKYLDFVNKALELEGGTALSTLYEGEEVVAPSPEADTTVANEDTTKANETTKKNEDKDSGVSPVVIVVIVVVVVAVIAAVVAFTKKKN